MIFSTEILIVSFDSLVRRGQTPSDRAVNSSCWSSLRQPRSPFWANQYSSGHINCHDCVDGTSWIVWAAGLGPHRRGSRPQRRSSQKEKHNWVLVITATTADALLESSHSTTASLLLEKCAQVSLELTDAATTAPTLTCLGKKFAHQNTPATRLPA